MRPFARARSNPDRLSYLVRTRASTCYSIAGGHWTMRSPTMAKAMSPTTISADDIRQFFAWSDWLDHEVLRPLSHIRSNWEASWDSVNRCYESENDSFATELNILIGDLTTTAAPDRYHDNEDIL